MTSRSLNVRITTIGRVAAAIFLTATSACDSTTAPKAAPKAPEAPVARIMPGQIVYSDPWGGIFVADSNGTAFTNLSAGSRDFDPAVSADGKQIAFSSLVGDEDGADIWVMNADGTHRLRLTHTVTASPSRHSNSPAWSPDGQRLAFVVSRGGVFEPKIFVMNADGSDMKQLTDDDKESVAPEWSPDGSRILFSRPSGQPEDFGIFEMNQDGSNVRQLHGDGSTPSRSPDGSRIAYIRGMGLFVMNSDGSNPTAVLSDGVDWDGKPTWSPDGKTVVFGIRSASRMCWDDEYNEYACGRDLKRVRLDGVIDTTWQIVSASRLVWQR